ncbi:alpha-L-fucosidase [Botrimarina mediterranea]|uniref:alpha-L-fucosidase n=1 Tax=Botrimarina mediterranea TaxID=2528022 RepID=A0A518K7U7_9BACT|nr:alpha-L-fucosidase [Botrimarina mediterranea]QDV73862.1 Alpha-L-fucosidase [Botrimarina mediterranea]QDV78492.1 Alpha-L-fucosidase [Planctomycetes bacterium K2D]
MRNPIWAVTLALASCMTHQTVEAGPPEPYRSETDLHTLQQRFVDLRFGMFIHYNMATYQDREWGDPKGPTEAFDPTRLDTDQWAEAARSAGMTYGCLTTKHHDGFCLWPTESGGDSVRDTPKKIDIVRAYVDSFRAKGLRVGLYYSILDLRGDIRHHNVEPADIERIKFELTELLTDYGPIDFLIFDGWDAPWSRITYEEVPFDDIYRHIKRLQPDCLVAELNAGVYPSSALYYSDIKAYEQNAGQNVPTDSRLPALSCVTLSDGWFWKSWDNKAELKSAEQVVDEWLLPLNARFCNLICNAAPNSEGRLSPNLISRLKEIGERIASKGDLPPMPRATHVPVITAKNLATGRPIRASDSPDTMGPDLANDGSFGSTWYPPSGQTDGWIEVDLAPKSEFNRVVFVEPVGRWDDYAQSRIESYKIEGLKGGEWTEVAAGNSSDTVRIATLTRRQADRVRVSIKNKSNRNSAHISEIGIYDEPGP